MPRPGGLAPADPLLRLLGALASGALLALAFPTPDVGWLAWFALVPLLLALRGAGPLEAFRLGFAAGLVAYGALIGWIRVFGVPAWILLTAAMALSLGAAAAGIAALAAGRRGAGAWLWAVPLTWTAVEVVRSVGPLGFPWGLLGLTQYRAPVVLALAPLVGVYGIGTLIALVNAILAVLLVTRRPARAVVAAGLVVAAALAWAGLRPAPPASAERVVAAIQPNVDPRVKGDAAAGQRIIAGLLRQTAEARAGGADLIVYPETAVPFDLVKAPELLEAIARRAGGAVVVAGVAASGPRNALLVIGPNGRPLGEYAKRRLVPFGEAGVRPGGAGGPIRTPVGALAPVICYESAFGGLVRPLVAGGAEIVVILTNDGWFGRSAGPAQHTQHAVLRAAETGRSVVRAANTGTSMLIGPGGGAVATQPLDTEGVLLAALPVGGPPTPYVQWGWLLGPAAVLGWLLAAAPGILPTLRRRAGAARALGLAIVIPAGPYLLGRLAGTHAEGASLPGTGLLASLGVVAAAALVGRGHMWRGRGAPASLALAAAVTGLLLAAMRAAYAHYGFDVGIGPSGEGWGGWILRHLVAGIAAEAWLRGGLFAAASRLGGWPLAAVLGGAVGMALHLGGPQELLIWQVLTGVAFAAIRRWTGDAVGLGPARGLGDAVVAGLAGLR